MRPHFLLALTLAVGVADVAIADVTVQMHKVSATGKGDPVGSVVISESKYGLIFTPQLKGLPAGAHGFHLHEKPDCGPAEQDGKAVAAGGAGGHFDPQKKGKHDLPWGDGHLGDLPALYVNQDGTANNPVLAPRLKVLTDVSGRALMIHKGGDNHSDHPEPLGGGGARIACGVIAGQQ